MASLNLDPGNFKAIDANPGGTLELFNKYVERMRLIFDLAFRKADGTPYEPTDKEKKAMLLFRGGDDMRDLFHHVGKIVEADTFNEAIKKIEDLTAEVVVGNVYEGKVLRLLEFGAIVSVLPGKDGLLHISQLANERVNQVSDYVKEGQDVRVKVIEADDKGRLRLSMKALLNEEKDKPADSEKNEVEASEGSDG